MNEWNSTAETAYRAEIARLEAAGNVADEASAMRAARDAVMKEIRASTYAQTTLEEAAAETAMRHAHARVVADGKRQMEKLASGQAAFEELGILDAVVPIGEGMVSSVGQVDDPRLDMMDEVRKQNLFKSQRRYQEWSDGFRRPVKSAFRTMPSESTIRDAVDQGKLS